MPSGLITLHNNAYAFQLFEKSKSQSPRSREETYAHIIETYHEAVRPCVVPTNAYGAQCLEQKRKDYLALRQQLTDARASA